MVDGVGAQTNVFVNASHPYLGTLSSSVAIASGEAGLVAVQPSSGTLLDVFRIAIPDGDPCRWTSCVCGHETFSLGCLSGPLLLPAALRPCQGSTVECIVADGTNRTLTLAIPVTPLSNGTVSRRALNLVERAQVGWFAGASRLLTCRCRTLPESPKVTWSHRYAQRWMAIEPTRMWVRVPGVGTDDVLID